MSERMDLGSAGELEARLADLATALAFPPTPDLATSVGERLRTAVGAGAATVGAGAATVGAGASTGATGPSPSAPARPRVVQFRRSVRRSLLLAAALSLLIVGGALAVRFGLELLSIQFGPVPTLGPPSPSPRAPGALGAGLALGRPLTLEEVRAAAPFDVLVPAVLGKADAAYLGGSPLRGQVALVYAPRDDLPPSSLLQGAGLLVTQNRGGPDHGLANKLADNGLATVESVVVGGAPGLWIAGQPHMFWYLAPDGTAIEDSRRLVGNTLAWERDGVLYRIEGEITLDRALEIAQSMR